MKLENKDLEYTDTQASDSDLSYIDTQVSNNDLSYTYTQVSDNDLSYATEVRKARRKTGLKTQEFFTPESLVKKMCDNVSEEDWSDITKTVLEPSFGNGNFLVEIYARKLSYCKNEEDVYTALSSVYGVELMEDNVQECKERVLFMLLRYESTHNIYLDDKLVMKILDENLVCSDFFKWNFEEWRPMTEEEYKQSNKKKQKC